MYPLTSIQETCLKLEFSPVTQRSFEISRKLFAREVANALRARLFVFTKQVPSSVRMNNSYRCQPALLGRKLYFPLIRNYDCYCFTSHIQEVRMSEFCRDQQEDLLAASNSFIKRQVRASRNRETLSQMQTQVTTSCILMTCK